MLKQLFQLTVILTLLLTSFSSFTAHKARAAETGHTTAKQAIMIDYDTGMVLFEKNADEKMPTSSMSKVMTMYMVFEALKDKRLSLDTKLPVSEKAWRKGGSKMFVEVGDSVTVEDLIRGVIVQSGNDATIVLAEGLAGTEEAFADGLNAKAAALGMTNSHFVNASGWPDPDHYSTARDLSTLAKAIIHNFPDRYPYFAEKEFTYNNIKQPNRNPLLYRNIGADGLKTGHTEVGGYGLIGSGERNGRRTILVINGLPNDKARAQESARLIDWGLRGFENVKLFSAGETVTNAKVVMGKAEQVPLMLENDLTVTVPIAVRNDLKVQAIYSGPLVAPVEKGQQVGTLQIEVPRIGTFEAPLLAADTVNKLGFFASTLAKAKLMLSGSGADSE